jgi:ribA/ribD-fused uncharacterized protein
MIKQFQGKYRFLSNFWTCKVVYDGKEFTSVEHGYQYSKCFTQEDKDKMFSLIKPGDCKRLGRRIKIRPDFNDVKLGIMEDLVRQKFQDPSLREMLMSTGTEELQEGNRWGDKFWGVDLKTGEGDNHLGKILMKVRGGQPMKTEEKEMNEEINELEGLEGKIEQNTKEFKILLSQRKFNGGRLVKEEQLENEISKNKSEWIKLVTDSDLLRHSC